MAHEWRPMTTEELGGMFKAMSTFDSRKCTKCGAEQKKEVEHSWMRVVGYQWLPLVGRCPKDKKVKS